MWTDRRSRDTLACIRTQGCRTIAAVAIVLSLVGCASRKERPASAGDVGTAAPSELVVSRKSSSRFEVEGVAYTFGELVDEIRRRESPAVLVGGVKTVADALCVAELGAETGAAARFIGADGEAKAVSFVPEPGADVDLARTCRE